MAYFNIPTIKQKFYHNFLLNFTIGNVNSNITFYHMCMFDKYVKSSYLVNAQKK